jgi:hypothetical protein
VEEDLCGNRFLYQFPFLTKGFMGSNDCVLECEFVKGEWKAIIATETFATRSRSDRSSSRLELDQDFIVRVEAIDNDASSQCCQELGEFFVIVSFWGPRDFTQRMYRTVR